MKIRRLLLQAFGPFTQDEINLAGGGQRPETNLHLIYGPNEAGKSSALRAMIDLRFGIPPRSQDDFLHPSGQLRISGVFLTAEGEHIGLVRRKGRGVTLSRFDVGTGDPADSTEVPRQIEQALCGGLERAEFEAMFGLDHTRLRAGGDRLLKGEGELGSALFEASAGTHGIAAILAGLDADAKAFFNLHGRAQSATINEARRQLDEHRQQWRQAQIRPADWQTLNRAHEQARDGLAQIDRTLETLRRQENELTELRTVEPLLREHDRALAELQALDEVPDLAESAREDRLSADQALRRAREDLRGAELELARCAEALDALSIEKPLLEHAEAIERLSAAAETVARGRIEVEQQEAVIGGMESEIAAAAARITRGQSVEHVVSAALSEADRVALDGHLVAIGKLGERLDGHRNRAEELEQAEKADAGAIPALPDPAARQRLLAALEEAQGLGDISRQITEADRVIRGLDGQLAQALSDLSIESTDALRGARPLLDAQILSARKDLGDADESLRRLREEDSRLESDLRQQRLRQRELEAAGEIVTAETLRLAREHRDEGWTLIRQAYVERTHNADDLARSFDAGGSLPKAFEAAQSDADRQADLLRADATRAAGYEECATRIRDMETRRAEIAAELTTLGNRSQALQAGWSRQLADASLPDLGPDALRQWQTERAGALEFANRLGQTQADRQRLASNAKSAADTLSAALTGIGETVQSSALPQLIAQADRWEKGATKAEAEHSAKAKADKARQAERQKVDGLINKTQAEMESHLSAVQAWHARLFLAAGSTPETVKARLDELGGLARQSAALAEARLRQAQQRAVVEDFSVQTKCLADELGEPVPGPRLAEDFADRLKRRLVASREQEQQRRNLVRDKDRAQNTKRNAEAEEAAQTGILAQLCTAAGVATAEQLPEREDSASRKRQLQATVATSRQQLTLASTCSEDALRASLAGRDAVAVDSERERCRAEINRLEQEQAAARQSEEKTRRALEEIDSSDRAANEREAMEAAAAKYRSAIRPWARLRLAHALLLEALSRFRERAQAPMVAAASTYFSVMTGSRYRRLVADETDSKPVLRAEREDGKMIGVDAMSEGTADQLYLALRLAALELRHASHPQMPLILDDVLITSDDERAANVLRALVRFAKGGQVLLFTHHRHLIDLARATLDEGVFATHTL